LNHEDLQLLTKAALEVERRHMTAPLIMLLEMHRPLSFVLSSFFLALGPLVQIFFTIPGYQRIAELMENRDNVVQFLEMLEQAGRGELAEVCPSESD